MILLFPIFLGIDFMRRIAVLELSTSVEAVLDKIRSFEETNFTLPTVEIAFSTLKLCVLYQNESFPKELSRLLSDG